MSETRGDAIVCTCHGSRFLIKDGSVLRQRATKPIEEAKATVSGKNVVVEA